MLLIGPSQCDAGLLSLAEWVEGKGEPAGAPPLLFAQSQKYVLIMRTRSD